MVAERSRISSTVEIFIASKWFVRTSAIMQFVLDSISWALAAIAASYARFLIQGHHDPYGATKDSVSAVLPMVLGVLLIVGFAVGIYRRRWRYASFDEVAGLIVASGVTIFVLEMMRFFDSSANPFPRSVIAAAGVLALFLTAANRYAWRFVRERLRRPSSATATKIIVYGAGEGGIQVVNTLLRNPSSPYLPVAFLDDNEKTHRLSISGIPVLGGRNVLAEARGKTGAETLLIAIPSADSHLINEIAALARGRTRTSSRPRSGEAWRRIQCRTSSRAQCQETKSRPYDRECRPVKDGSSDVHPIHCVRSRRRG